MFCACCEFTFEADHSLVNFGVVDLAVFAKTDGRQTPVEIGHLFQCLSADDPIVSIPCLAQSLSWTWLRAQILHASFHITQRLTSGKTRVCSTCELLRNSSRRSRKDIKVSLHSADLVDQCVLGELLANTPSKDRAHAGTPM
jgi:hypothetical protein